LVSWRVVFSKHAAKDSGKLSAAGLKPKAQGLLAILAQDPFQNPPPYEKLVGDLAGAYSRRIYKYRLRSTLTGCLDRCAQQAADRGLKDLFGAQEDPAWPLTTAPQIAANFLPGTDYAPARAAQGRVFAKHLYPRVDAMNGPETAVAVVLDTLPEVAVWVRNLVGHPSSFRLPCPSLEGDWFYPDFVGRLTDERVFALEYKGGHLEAHDQHKRQIGLAWERATQGRGVFLWIGDSAETAKGRSIAEQVQAGLRGGGARPGAR
jgi:Txe/YoeB family toxin of Txe-Axe toxin-antitoxin module